jgi:glycosyltransferase involved in cell wall biosynthesis
MYHRAVAAWVEIVDESGSTVLSGYQAVESAPYDSPVTAPPERALRVIIVTETYPPEINGVAGALSRLVKHLHMRGHALWIVRPRQGVADRASAGERLQELLVRGYPLPMYPEMRFGLPSSRLLGRLIGQVAPNVIHVATEGPLGWAAVTAARRWQIPVTTDCRTNFHLYTLHYGLGLLKSLALRYLRIFHRRSAVTTVPTHKLGLQLAALGFGELAVVRRGVDSTLFSPGRRDLALRHSWGAAPDDLVAVYVGRLAAEKNIELVFRSFEAIRSNAPRARLVLVGDGPARSRLALEQPDALFLGPLTGIPLAHCYASGDVFLFPSLTETFGNVTMEALASGLAVVAFDYAAAGEHIVDGKNGRRVPFGDPGAFIAAAADLASRPDLVRTIGSAARASVLSESWDHVLAPFEQLLLQVAA